MATKNQGGGQDLTNGSNPSSKDSGEDAETERGQDAELGGRPPSERIPGFHEPGQNPAKGNHG